MFNLKKNVKQIAQDKNMLMITKSVRTVSMNVTHALALRSINALRVRKISFYKMAFVLTIAI